MLGRHPGDLYGGLSSTEGRVHFTYKLWPDAARYCSTLAMPLGEAPNTLCTQQLCGFSRLVGLTFRYAIVQYYPEPLGCFLSQLRLSFPIILLNNTCASSSFGISLRVSVFWHRLQATLAACNSLFIISLNYIIIENDIAYTFSVNSPF